MWSSGTVSYHRSGRGGLASQQAPRLETNTVPVGGVAEQSPWGGALVPRCTALFSRPEYSYHPLEQEMAIPLEYFCRLETALWQNRYQSTGEPQQSRHNGSSWTLANQPACVWDEL
eukprot:PhF_6_TR8302/c1_g1_i7/m.12815